MQSVRRCTNPECGWEFPLSYRLSKCRFCGSFLDTFQCFVCHEWKPESEFYRYKAGGIRLMCKPCAKINGRKFSDNNKEWRLKYHGDYRAKRQREAEKIYEEWKNTSQLPFKPLTEDQWLEACRYFNGCALCGNPHIEVRQFFLEFQNGGRYAPWNVYPTCTDCNPKVRRTENPFAWLRSQIRAGKIEKKYYDKLVEYFVVQIEKARDGNEQQGS
ncbi:hypothetical protein D3C87_1230790 [compost metagenome]